MNQRSPGSGSIPPWTLAIGAMFSVQLGSALSVHLISTVGPGGTAWLRLTAGAVIILVIARPPLRSLRWHDAPVLLGLGVTTGLQTVAFLAAIERIPLGTSVAIEFLGPMTVAAVHSHSRRALLWVGAAGAGVVLVTQTWRGNISAVGFGYAILAAVGWAAYIILTQRVGERFAGLSGLAMTIPVAACTAAIIGIPQAAGHLTPAVVAACVGLAILLPVVPYSFELLALRRMTPTAFGTLMALEPAIGVVLGLLVLHQKLSFIQVIGILLVVVAGAAAQRGGPRRPTIIDGTNAQPSTGPVPF
jgi:inner membrane transporter RhtA